MSNRLYHRPPALGFSLIEVVLAIGLSVVLMGLLASAISIYATRTNASSVAVEQGQLTRGVMRMIARDLESVATTIEQDTAAVASLAEAGANFDANEVDEMSDAADDALAGDASTRPAFEFFGTVNEMQFSILRPRAVAPAIEYGSGAIQPAPASTGGITTVWWRLTEEGLARHEQRRDLVLWADQQGDTSVLEQAGRVIAPEVANIVFAYTDGQETRDNWDSAEQNGAMPIAVEARVTFREPNSQEDEQPRLVTRRIVVALTEQPQASTENESLDL